MIHNVLIWTLAGGLFALGIWLAVGRGHANDDKTAESLATSTVYPGSATTLYLGISPELFSTPCMQGDLAEHDGKYFMCVEAHTWEGVKADDGGPVPPHRIVE